jgi:hypothetical protein
MVLILLSFKYSFTVHHYVVGECLHGVLHTFYYASARILCTLPQYKMSEIQETRNTFSFVKTGLTKENAMGTV